MKPLQDGQSDRQCVPIASLRAEARRIIRADFVHCYPHPVLVSTGPPPSERVFSRRTDDALQASVKRTQVEPEELTGDYNDVVFFVAKRPNNMFPNMVSLGRALNNDIPILLDTISKVHGYLLRDGPRWSYTDHRSRNGTMINGKALIAEQRIWVEDGDRWRIGLEFFATFMLPGTFYDWLHRGG